MISIPIWLLGVICGVTLTLSILIIWIVHVLMHFMDGF
jgi:hypothetical protein